MASAKICYISPLHQHIYHWMETFSKRGYDTSLITDASSWVAPQIRFAPVWVLPTLTKYNLGWRSLLNTFSAIKILKRTKPDLVHLHARHYFSLGLIVNKVPYILTSWGIEVIELPRSNFLFRSWAKTTAKRAKMITVDANFLKEIWIKSGVPREKIRVIPFGVDTHFFNPQIEGSIVRDKLGIDDNDIVVISTRPFINHHYDVKRIIMAIPLIVRKHPSVKFILKGSGPLEGYLKDLVERLKVTEHVHFAGLVPHEEVARYLTASDIYVSTCSYDSTSVSLLEAMACGLAPVVTDTLGNQEWIKDEVNGFLFPPTNHKELAEKINQLIENKPLRRAFGQRCIEEVKRNANWKKSVSEMEAIYEALL